MNRQKRFRELFRLCEDIQLQSSEIMCLRSQSLRREVILENIKLKWLLLYHWFVPFTIENNLRRPRSQ